MTNPGIRNDLIDLKSKLENIEVNLHDRMNHLDERAQKWSKIDEEIEQIIKTKDVIIRFNIGGKKFSTSLETLAKKKDSLFYKIIGSKSFDLNKEIYIERSPIYFADILEFLRFGLFNQKQYSTYDLTEILLESEYYELSDLSDILKESLRDIKIISYEFSGPYNYGSNIGIIGNNTIDRIEDQSLMFGVVSNYPGWITFELNAECEFEELDIGGYRGNPNYFAQNHGVSANISVSTDNQTWMMTSATIPSGFGDEVKRVRFNQRMRARYVKFHGNAYIGIGYLKFYKI